MKKMNEHAEDEENGQPLAGSFPAGGQFKQDNGFFPPDFLDELNISDLDLDEEAIDEISSENNDEFDYNDNDLETNSPIHNESLLKPESYEGEGARFMENVARDETVDDILFYIQSKSKLSPQAQARLAVFSACFQSKNTVYSVFTDKNDFMQALDDLKYVKKVMRFGLKRRDRNVDWETSLGLIESQSLLRLRQSKGGMARKQLNTTVSESVHETREARREEQKSLAGKIPIIGRYF